MLTCLHLMIQVKDKSYHQMVLIYVKKDQLQTGTKRKDLDLEVFLCFSLSLKT